MDALAYRPDMDCLYLYLVGSSDFYRSYRVVIGRKIFCVVAGAVGVAVSTTVGVGVVVGSGVTVGVIVGAKGVGVAAICGKLRGGALLGSSNGATGVGLVLSPVPSVCPFTPPWR